MNLNVTTILAVALLTLATSCSNDDENNDLLPLEGTFTGIFRVEYTGGETHSNPVTVTFNGDGYSSSASQDRFPAGGSGKFERGGNSLEFADENIWTADFDWNLILDGDYKYSQSGNSLTFSAQKNDVGTYTYELTRQ